MKIHKECFCLNWQITLVYPVNFYFGKEKWIWRSLVQLKHNICASWRQSVRKKREDFKYGGNELCPGTIASQYYFMSTQYKTLWKSYRYTVVNLWGERGVSSPWTNVPWGLGLISTLLWLFVEQHSFIVDQSPSMPGLKQWILSFHTSSFFGKTKFTNKSYSETLDCSHDNSKCFCNSFLAMFK